MIVEIQCFEGDGYDFEAAYTAKQELRRDAVEDQWTLVDYLDNFNHVIDAHQWHTIPKSMASYVTHNYDKRQFIVTQYRDDLSKFYEFMHRDMLAAPSVVRGLLTHLGAMVSMSTSRGFTEEATRVFNILEQWRRDLIDIEAYPVEYA